MRVDRGLEGIFSETDTGVFAMFLAAMRDLSPEELSGRLFAGAGPHSMRVAAHAWETLATQLVALQEA